MLDFEELPKKQAKKNARAPGNAKDLNEGLKDMPVKDENDFDETWNTRGDDLQDGSEKVTLIDPRNSLSHSMFTEAQSWEHRSTS